MGMFWLPFGLTPKPKSGGIRYADVYARGVAAGLDLFLLFLLLGPLFEIVSAYIYRDVDTAEFRTIEAAETFTQMLSLLWNSAMIDHWFANSLFQLTVIGGLMVAVQSIWGNTPGKRLLGLKVARAETLAPLPWWRYAIRFLAYIPAALPLMIGIFWASFNKQRRGWHDYIAGTVVVHIRPEGWYWEQVKALYRKYIRKQAPTAD